MAKTRCGGEAALQSAIARGDVQVADHKGTQLYYFPEVRMGERQSISQTISISRGKRTDDASFNVIQESLQSLGWSIKATDKQIEVAYSLHRQM